MNFEEDDETGGGNEIETLVAKVDALTEQVRTLRSIVASTGLIASDEELDSKFGDPTVRFVPRAWTGDGFKGKRYSECSPDFLDILSGALTEMANKDEAAGKLYNGKPSHVYSRKDAARARGWSMRIRDRGGRPPEPESEPPPAAFGGGGLPFGRKEQSAAPFAESQSPFGSGAPFAPTATTSFDDDDGFGDDEIPF